MPLDFLQTCFTPIEHCMCTGLQNRCKNRMKEWVAERCTKAFFPRKPLLRMIPVDLVWDPPSNLLLLPQSQFSFESCKKTGSSLVSSQVPTTHSQEMKSGGEHVYKYAFQLKTSCWAPRSKMRVPI